MELIEEERREVANGLTIVQTLAIILAGVVCNLQEILILVVWIVVCLISVFAFLKGRMNWIWYAIAASPGLEVWARMSRAPMVPQEIGKYYLVLAITLILMHRLKQPANYAVHNVGKVLLFVMIPSLFVNLATFDYENWVFSGLGIIEMTLLLILASGERWDTERFCKALQFGFLPLIPILVFSTLKTPTYDDVEFKLVANSSGGFGSNQVSTIMGVGIVLATLLLILRRPVFAFRPLNYLFIVYLLFRGLMTFSRGGVVVAVLAIVVAFLPNMFANTRAFARYSLMFILLGILGYGVFITVNDMTGNLLLNRYMGETAGTLDRTREKSLNSMTSGRADIMTSDFEIFKDNPMFGVGIGMSKTERVKYGYDEIVAHTEFSRLFSEQGIGGGIVAIGLLIFAAYWVFKQRLSAWRGITASLFVLAIATTFHAAMRTNTSPVFYALAAIPVFFYQSQESEEEQEPA